MIVFFWSMALLLAVAALGVLFFGLRRVLAVPVDAQALTAQVYQERLAELQAQRVAGVLEDAEFGRAQEELIARLADELPIHSGSRQVGDWRLPFVLGVVVIGLAMAGYAWRGGIEDVALSVQLTQTDPNDPQARRDLAQALSSRLERQPENGYYWFALADLQMMEQQFAAAAGSYERLVALAPEDQTLQIRWLQARYLAAGGVFDDSLRQQADRLLQQSPRQPMLLGLLGIDAYNREAYEQAIAYWERLLIQMPATAPQREVIESSLAEAWGRLGRAMPGEADRPGVRLQIELAEGVAPAGVVYVFARPAGVAMGPPLAVVQLDPTALPLTLTLDQRYVMLDGSAWADGQAVDVVARLSRQGSIQRASGDVEVHLKGAIIGADDRHTLRLEQVLP